jgi:uncharacterized protein (TIGR02284 family)
LDLLAAIAIRVNEIQSSLDPPLSIFIALRSRSRRNATQVNDQEPWGSDEVGHPHTELRMLAYIAFLLRINKVADHIDHMKSLHTTVVDACNGYEEALKDAEGKGLSPLFREMISLHKGHAEALAADLTRHGVQVDDNGSFLSTIHRAVINIRSLFGGLDESILPGLVDGEERVVSYYDEALTDCPPSETSTLAAQRGALLAKIVEMKGRVHNV